MIGGTVIEVVELPDKLWVNCQERQTNDRCAIYVERSSKSLCIQPGDSLWWQCGQAMWTPLSNKKMTDLKQGKHFDIKLRKIGYSGSTRPKL